jgi:hypothetical protein
MYVLPDYTILCICNKGYIQIHGFSAIRISLFQMESPTDINDMELCLDQKSITKDTTHLEFALATDEGLQFI